MADLQTAQREQSRASQLMASRTQTKKGRLDLAMKTPGKWVRNAMLAASIGGATSPAERYQTESAQRSADHRAQQSPEGLDALAEQGLISKTQHEEMRSEHAAIQTQAATTATVAGTAVASQRKRSLQEHIRSLAENSKLMDTIQESREQLWRGLRVGGPATDDAVGGTTLGMGTIFSYVVWIWSALKGIRYRNEPEPLTVIAILSPPPMSLRTAGKDAGKVVKTIVTLFIDALGFLWNNINLAIVVVLITLNVMIVIGLTCTISPLFFVENSGLCLTFAKMVASY
ncbi:MAG: hypothetical protein AAB337_00565 [Patescibacteria group bacterium]